MSRPITIACTLALAAVLFAACGDNDSAGGDADTTSTDFTELDRSWDAEDSAFAVDYDSARAAGERLAAQQASDSAATARIEAHNRTLADIETRRADLRRRREAARAAGDRAAYESARAEADYQTWRADVQRVRTEQSELEGMISVGSKSVGGVDVNAKPENQDKPLIRVEPGKEDDKPLIEKNRNP